MGVRTGRTAGLIDRARLAGRVLEPIPGRAEDVLGLVADEADLIVPLANGEPCRCSTPSRSTPPAGTAYGSTRCVLHDRPYLHGTVRDHLVHVSYFSRTSPGPPSTHGAASSCPTTSARSPPAPETTSARSCSARRRPRTATVLLARDELRLRGAVHRARPFFLESTTGCRTFGANQIHHSQVAGLVEVDRPLVEHRAPNRPTSTAASPGRSPSGSPTARPSRWASARSRAR